MKLYGIKNCDSVKKAIKLLKQEDIAYEFVDLKEYSPTINEIKTWLEQGVELKKLFNARSTTYRNLKLKELELDEAGKIEWLSKEPMLIKRPVIELDNNTFIVGFNADEYNQKLH